MHHFTPETQHLRSYFRDLAAGSAFRPSDLTEEMRVDWAGLTSAEKAEIQDLTKQAASTIAALRDGGHLQKAREAADETAAAVANVVGDRIAPTPERKLPDDPRALAALIRRR